MSMSTQLQALGSRRGLDRDSSKRDFSERKADSNSGVCPDLQARTQQYE